MKGVFKDMKIKIYVGPTWIRIPCDKQGLIDGIYDVGSFIKDNLRQREWNPRFNCYVTTYNFSHYDLLRHEGLLPRYALEPLKEYLGDDITFEEVTVKPVEVKNKFKNVRIRPQFQPRDEQKDLIEFLTSDDSYTPLSAQCGVGKTFCSIYAAVQNGGPILIVLGLLITQWYKALKQFTNITKGDIVVVQGFDTLKNLWDMLDNGFKPKVVIFSTRTLFMYAVSRPSPYDSLPSYKKLQETIGFATKIFDECHLNFYANTQIDLQSSISHNIYLSATYMRSDPQGKKIFNLVFPPEKRFGEQQVKKYSTVLMVEYRLSLFPTVNRKVSRQQGYLHALYEKYLLKHRNSYFDTFATEVVIPLIRMYYLNIKKEHQKMLILCKTKAFVEALADYIRPYMKDTKVSVYFSGDSGKAGKQKNLESDIIVSTTNSCSTGVDIKGLKTCINTVSFSSEPQAAQILGRLREIPGEDTYFIDLWCSDLSAHCWHKRNRAKVYKERALRMTEFTIR